MKKLTDEQYRVCIMGGTEPPFTGKYLHVDKRGTFHCAVCEHPLFHTDQKYDSGTGWPSFWQPATELKFVGNEVRCPNCNAHLGHVFDDGPPPTGKRYCINSVALELVDG